MRRDDFLYVVDGDRNETDTGPPVDVSAMRRAFRAVGEDRYVFAIPDLQLELDVDRLRRERHELKGELAVRCGLAGARAVNGNSLSTADFNLSSTRARAERGRYLDKLTDATEIDWVRLLEEFCQRVLTAEREGQPATLLREFERPVDDHLDVDGVRLHRRHPVILFGDGGTAKSYTALYLAGQLQRRNVRVLYADWEFAGEDHRDRLERLFGSDMPGVQYVRCARPLVYEADRIRRVVQEDEIAYVIYDSIALACDGPSEASEVAGGSVLRPAVGTGTMRVTIGSDAGRVLERQPSARLVLRPSVTRHRGGPVTVRGPPTAEQRQQHLVGDPGTLECLEPGCSEPGGRERIRDVIPLDQLDQHGLANPCP